MKKETSVLFVCMGNICRSPTAEGVFRQRAGAAGLTLEIDSACPPQHRHKLALFMEYATDSDADAVPDPYYGGANGFDQVLDYIEDAADGLIAALRRK